MMINHVSMSRALQSIHRQKQVHWQKLLVREKEVHTSARLRVCRVHVELGNDLPVSAVVFKCVRVCEQVHI